MESTTIDIETSLIKRLPALKSQAFNLTHNIEDAEDLVNEACLKILSNKHKFSNNKNINGWFSVILRNIFINNYRRNKTANIVELSEEDYNYTLSKMLSNISSDSNLFCSEILEILDKNKLGYKEFISYLNGYTYQQIADIFELNIGTVKSRIFFYKKYIQQLLIDSGYKSS